MIPEIEIIEKHVKVAFYSTYGYELDQFDICNGRRQPYIVGWPASRKFGLVRLIHSLNVSHIAIIHSLYELKLSLYELKVKMLGIRAMLSGAGQPNACQRQGRWGLGCIPGARGVLLWLQDTGYSCIFFLALNLALNFKLRGLVLNL